MANTTPNKYALQVLEDVLQNGDDTHMELSIEDAVQVLVDEVHTLRGHIIDLQSEQVQDVSDLYTRIEQLEEQIEEEE